MDRSMTKLLYSRGEISVMDGLRKYYSRRETSVYTQIKDRATVMERDLNRCRDIDG